MILFPYFCLRERRGNAARTGDSSGCRGKAYFYGWQTYHNMKNNIVVFEDYTLREALLEDASVIWQAIDSHRDYLVTWLPFVAHLKREEDEEAFLAGVLAVPYAERNLVFIIEKDGEFCGLVGFVTTDLDNHRTEIGYWLLPEYQGKGVMTRCVDLLCRWAVENRSMNRIQIRCAVGNRPSNAIPCRLGFTPEGKERDGELLASGTYTDIQVYSILKKELR